VASLAAWRKNRNAAAGAAALLALCRRTVRRRPRSSSGRAGTNGIRGQPASRQFGLADQYNVSASQAHAVDEIYRLLARP
jgi:hypothetical protein